MIARELLDALLAATPYPPPHDTEALLAAFHEIHTARQAILDAMPGMLLEDLDRARVHELLVRDQAWQTALTNALDANREQRIGAHKVRAYAI